MRVIFSQFCTRLRSVVLAHKRHVLLEDKKKQILLKYYTLASPEHSNMQILKISLFLVE